MKSHHFFTLFPILFIVLFFFIGSTQPVLAARECGEGLGNPLGECDMSFLDLWLRILQSFLGAVSIIAMVMLVYGGMVMLTSSGNPDRVKRAKDTLMWAILGIAVILFSGAIMRYVFENFQF